MVMPSRSSTPAEKAESSMIRLVTGERMPMMKKAEEMPAGWPTRRGAYASRSPMSTAMMMPRGVERRTAFAAKPMMMEGVFDRLVVTLCLPLPIQLTSKSISVAFVKKEHGQLRSGRSP